VQSARRELKAGMSEIFSSLQGEGLRVGERHLFLRFRGCNLRCRYCDTPEALREQGPCRARLPQGDRSQDNPLGVEELLRAVASFSPRLNPWVSLTGGEPLLWDGFLGELLPQLRRFGYRTYLETNGTLADALPALLRHLDLVAMDLKPPSAMTDGQDVFPAHEAFLDGLGEVPLFAKLVVALDTNVVEVSRAASVLARHAPRAALVLQPVTPRGGVRSPSSAQLLQLAAAADRHVREVRVIPQVHRHLGLP
jgi:organic radical activating enzyme